MEDMRIAILNDDIIPPGEGPHPMHAPNQNHGYAMLFAEAARRGLPLVLGNDRDYHGGRLDRGWIHDGDQWTGWTDVGVLMVYDQFQSNSPEGRAKTRSMMARGIPVFNHPDVTLVVDDKLLSHRNFPEMMPYTHYFHKGQDHIEDTVKDFFAGVENAGFGEVSSFVAKPQVGWGGMSLHRFTQENIGDIFNIPDGEYVLQPFLESGTGIPELGVKGRHDLRVLLANGKFATAMVRQPARHDWIANYFDPEEMIYINEPGIIPSDIMNTIYEADRRFADYFPRLIAFDVARLASGRVICWEMNSRPGIAPDSGRADDLRSAELLMQGICDCFEAELSDL